MLKRALISVSKKDGIIEFARGLATLGIEIVSTGGTARAIRDAGIAVKDISDLTGFPEILDGRVKTLHPKVHGGLLGIRENPSHQRQMAEQQISPIDLVVVNLYPFRRDGCKTGNRVRRGNREYRHRWTLDDPLGGEKFPGCGSCRRPG